MAEDVDISIIKKTQDRLGKYIKKPPLQEKLLKRPPFRFLHDIIANVVKFTSFMKGLYTPEELVSENVKDKESKIIFLQKAIDVVVFVTGDSLSVKPSKIVSGHDADKTNEFLQCIAKAIKSKVDSSDAVKKVLSGEKPDKTSNKPSDNKSKQKSPKKHVSKENIPSKEAEPERIAEKSKKPVKERRRDSVKAEKTPSTKIKDKHDSKINRKDEKSREHLKEKSRSSQKNKDGHRGDKKRRKSKVEPDVNEHDSPKKDVDAVVDNDVTPIDDEKRFDNAIDHNDEHVGQEESQPTTNGHSEESGNLQNELAESNSVQNDVVATSPNKDTTPKRAKTPRPPSARGYRHKNVIKAKKDEEIDLKEVNEIKGNNQGQETKEPAPPPPTAASVRSARPTSRMGRSARPMSARPAAPKVRQRDVIEESQVRPESVKPPVNVIMQAEDGEEEDETFLVEDAPAAPPDLIQDETAAVKDDEEINAEAQGSLVKQLLETKKDLEGGSQQVAQRKTEIDNSFISNTQKRKEMEIFSKEVDSIRNSIQTLTRSANPLGKLMDYLQEDIDSMQKEVRLWHDENGQNNIDLNREQELTHRELEPLKAQLLELDNAIEHQRDKIHSVKCNILYNEERLHKILNSMRFISK